MQPCRIQVAVSSRLMVVVVEWEAWEKGNYFPLPLCNPPALQWLIRAVLCSWYKSKDTKGQEGLQKWSGDRIQSEQLTSGLLFSCSLSIPVPPPPTQFHPFPTHPIPQLTFPNSCNGDCQQQRNAAYSFRRDLKMVIDGALHIPLAAILQ